MNGARTKIYVKATREINEIVYTGIEFAEFIEYSPKSLDNLMIISGGSSAISFESKFDRGLELFEGRKNVYKLAKEAVYGLGDLCFVDYASPGSTTGLSEEQIAELLYLGFMFKPLQSPFFEPLQNNFAYLAHDDGWYCKLYCRDMDDFGTVLCSKIIAAAAIQNSCEILYCTKNRILQLAEQGLLIDLEELTQKSSHSINLYSIGAYSDMDAVLNNCQTLKKEASQINQFCFCR